VSAIAKRLVLGVAATAQPDDGASAESEEVAVDVGDDEVAFDADGTVRIDRDFRWHLYLNPNNKLRSILTGSARQGGMARRGAPIMINMVRPERRVVLADERSVRVAPERPVAGPSLKERSDRPERGIESL